MNNVKFVVCEICGAQKRELNGHIRIHGLVKAQYREKFPNALMQCEEIRLEKSQKIKTSSFKRPPVSEATKARMSESQKKAHVRLREDMGEDEYLAVRYKVCEEMRNRKGVDYQHSPETLAKMRGPRPNSRVPKSEIHKANIKKSAQNRKRRNPHSEKTIQKMKTSAMNRLEKQVKDPNYAKKFYDTKPELMFQSYLEKHHIKFSKQIIIETYTGKVNYDFYLEDFNLLVEIDGEYWHAKTLKQIQRDIFKTRVALAMGYGMIRISDMDFRPELILLTHEEQQIHNDHIISIRLSKFDSGD